MKSFLNFIRWFLGVALIITTIGGFGSGEIIMPLFFLILGILLLPPVTNAFVKKKKQTVENINNNVETPQPKSESFQSKLNKIKFPDRFNDIFWHLNAINKGLSSGNLNLANLSYAKLIESIRQQNINEKGKYEDELKAIREEYLEFRQIYKLEYPPQFLPPSQRKKLSNQKTLETDNSQDLIKVSSKTGDKNSVEFTIELNEKEFIKRVNEGTIGKENPEKSIDDITGFWGINKYSSNKEYCVSYSDGFMNNGKWEIGNLALLKRKTLLFKKRIERPNDCNVTNDGIVICCDWQNTDKLNGCFFVFDKTGEQLFLKNTTANLGKCAISDNSKIAIFETYTSETNDANKIFIVDIEKKNIIHKFQRIFAFNDVIIDTDKQSLKLKNSQGFIFEIDFEGNQINKTEYENQVLTTGSVYDCLMLYEKKPNEQKLKDDQYLQLLFKGLNDKDALYSFGQDRLYRKIGECYDALGDIKQTIDYWEKALQINPNVGIQRKLDTLRKKL